MVRGLASQVDPGRKFEAHTKSDSTNFTNGLTRALYVGTGGDVVAVDEDGTAVTFPSVPSGAVLPIAVKRVNSTSTTASGFVGIF